MKTNLEILATELEEILYHSGSIDYKLKVIRVFQPQENVLGVNWNELTYLSFVVAELLKDNENNIPDFVLLMVRSNIFEMKWIGYFLLKMYFNKFTPEQLLFFNNERNFFFKHRIKYHVLPGKKRKKMR